MKPIIQSLNEYSALTSSSASKFTSIFTGKNSAPIETSSKAGISVFIVAPVVQAKDTSQDIDDFIAELLQDDPTLEANLSEGRKWVAEAWYGNEPHSLKALRLRAGLSQAQLAERIGMKQPNISELESGKRKPSADTLQRLAQALAVSADEILQGIQPSAEEV